MTEVIDLAAERAKMLDQLIGSLGELAAATAKQAAIVRELNGAVAIVPGAREDVEVWLAGMDQLIEVAQRTREALAARRAAK